jgi:hypothetical protein
MAAIYGQDAKAFSLDGPGNSGNLESIVVFVSRLLKNTA